MISAKIIADSISPTGQRLTTFVLEYPRYILAELNTHRALSRNSASSRAIPISKMISDVYRNPACPVHWGANQKGMQADTELTGIKRWLARRLWMTARYGAIATAWTFSKIGLHKQIGNRVLEPWFMMRTLVSATDYQNFFALRAHVDAQPEIRELALCMLEAYKRSDPVNKAIGEWHIPFGDIECNDSTLINAGYAAGMDLSDGFVKRGSAWVINDLRCRVAIARCARISYLTHGTDKVDYVADLKLCERLFGTLPRHLSPAEHVAECSAGVFYYGNFAGWKQYRKIFADENANFNYCK